MAENDLHSSIVSSCEKMSHDKTQLIEILKGIIKELWEYAYIDCFQRFDENTEKEIVEWILPLLTALDISVEDLGLLD